MDGFRHNHFWWGQGWVVTGVGNDLVRLAMGLGQPVQRAGMPAGGCFLAKACTSHTIVYYSIVHYSFLQYVILQNTIGFSLK